VVKEGLGHRIYQVQQPRNRRLADVRRVDALPPHRRVEDVQVLTPEELVAWKVMSAAARRNSRKGFMDQADLRGLLVTFPQLKAEPGVVEERLRASGAGDAVTSLWRELAAEEIAPEDEDAEF
jgi:hypothetical protein